MPNKTVLYPVMWRIVFKMADSYYQVRNNLCLIMFIWLLEAFSYSTFEIVLGKLYFQISLINSFNYNLIFPYLVTSTTKPTKVCNFHTCNYGSSCYFIVYLLSIESKYYRTTWEYTIFGRIPVTSSILRLGMSTLF